MYNECLLIGKYHMSIYKDGMDALVKIKLDDGDIIPILVSDYDWKDIKDTIGIGDYISIKGALIGVKNANEHVRVVSKRIHILQKHDYMYQKYNKENKGE